VAALARLEDYSYVSRNTEKRSRFWCLRADLLACDHCHDEQNVVGE
jgi:hypothetical protein